MKTTERERYAITANKTERRAKAILLTVTKKSLFFVTSPITIRIAMAREAAGSGERNICKGAGIFSLSDGFKKLPQKKEPAWPRWINAKNAAIL